MSWRWTVLLTLALVAPVGLPAGGGERRRSELQRRRQGEPLLALGNQPLSCSPHAQAPALAEPEQGLPLEVLRTWRDGRGCRWLQVNTPVGRGWLAAWNG